MPVPAPSHPTHSHQSAGPARGSGPRLTRRALLGHAAGLAAIAALDPALGLPAPAAAAEPAALDLDGFIALSARLTGRDAEELDPEIAAGMLAALTGQGQGPALAQLAADDAGTDGAGTDGAGTGGAGTGGVLGNAVVAAWYSGIVGEGGDEQLLAYTDALLWGPLAFTKPAGWCGGATGYWAEPPEA